MNDETTQQAITQETTRHDDYRYVPKAWSNYARDVYVFLMGFYRYRTKFLDVKEWINYMEDVGWRFSTGDRVTKITCRRSLRMWIKMKERVTLQRMLAASKKQSIEAKQERLLLKNEAKRREEARKAAMIEEREAASMLCENWSLCQEQCAKYSVRGGKPFCAAGVKIPPQIAPRPYPPRECRLFKGVEG